MKLFKDEKYFHIYLTCIIIDEILSVGVFVIGGFSIASMVATGFSLSVFLLLVVLLATVIFANILAWNSMFGYLVTPLVVLETNGDEICMTPDRHQKMTTIKKEDIKNIEIVRPMICRSGKRIVITTENDIYHLEDLADIDLAFEELEKWYKGEENKG